MYFESQNARGTNENPDYQNCKFGGPNTVVAIDLVVWESQKCGVKQYLLGLVELKDIPIKKHFQFLDTKYVTTEILVNLIEEYLLPETMLLIDDGLCIGNLYEILRNNFPVVELRSKLERLNTDTQNVGNNLSTVWKYAIESL